MFKSNSESNQKLTSSLRGLGKYGHIGISYTRGSIYPKEYLIAIPGVCLLLQELISQTDEVRDKTEQTHQLCSQTRTPL